MSCSECHILQYSHSENKEKIEGMGISSSQKTYVANCGQRWWSYNKHYNLWSKIDDDETWENVKTGCKIPVSIGNPSKNIEGFV